MARGSELSHGIRRRRTALGMSQSRVGAALGVSPLQVGRWERGEDVPDPSQVKGLASVLGADDATREAWIDEAERSVLPVRIVRAAPTRVPTVAPAPPPDGDPWSTPPEHRVAPPRLDRAALIGRRAAGGTTANGTNGNGSGGDVGTGAGSGERSLRRAARRDERRVRRELTLAHRERRAVAAVAAHRRIVEEAAARTGPLPMPARAPAPAGSANTGAVFPVPDTKRGSERVTYEGLGEVPPQRERLLYVLRLVGTVAALVVLAGLLWWAVGSLGDGLGAVVDLLRGGGGSDAPPEGLVFLFPG